MKKCVLSFPNLDAKPDAWDVGEKGLSLYQLASVGLRIPSGFILTVEFFKPWIDLVESSEAWKHFCSLSPEKMWGNDSLAERLPEFVLSEEQELQLKEALASLEKAPLLAIRPSLADPIIRGISFADRYETHLAVRAEDVGSLLSRVFRSCIDPRVYMIQRKRGLESPRIRIAVIVQEQIASESSGQALSVNPSDNDHDLSLIQSVWGLGDYLADGAVKPDCFTVDKVSRTILSKELGSKRVTSWLNFKNVVERRPDWKHNQFSLDEGHVLSITDTLKRAESLYPHPIKIEWALAKGEIHVLQAAPLDPSISLTPKLQTLPGEPRRIYLNLNQAFLGIQSPLSTSSIEFYTKLIAEIIRRLLGSDTLAAYWKQLITVWHGALYLDVTLLLSHFPEKRVTHFIKKLDPSSAKVLCSLDLKKFALQHPQHGLFATWMRVFFRNPGLPVKIVGTLLFPRLAHAGLQREVAKVEQKILDRSISRLTLDETASKVVRIFSSSFVTTFLPPIIASSLAEKYLRKTFAEYAQDHWKMAEHLRRLTHYHPEIHTRVFPLELHYLSRLIQVEKIESEADLIQQLHREDLSPSIKQAWLRTLERFGKKGPCMADLNAPRFHEENLQIIPSIFHLLHSSIGNTIASPQTIFEKNQQDRTSTSLALVDRAAEQFWPETILVRRAYKIAATFAYTRELLEEQLIDLLLPIRQRLLEEGSLFVTHNRLDLREQIFNFAFQQIDHAALHPTIDLRVLLAQAGTPTRMAKLIDSRGKIHDEIPHATNFSREEGAAIVPGKVRARARVLDSYRPQDFQPGEILVVSTLDAAWAPIIVLASAVVLETGGTLHPGVRAVIEHGIPCVSGIVAATHKIQTGDFLEVDGEKGVVSKYSSQS